MLGQVNKLRGKKKDSKNVFNFKYTSSTQIKINFYFVPSTAKFDYEKHASQAQEKNIKYDCMVDNSKMHCRQNFLEAPSEGILIVYKTALFVTAHIYFMR